MQEQVELWIESEFFISHFDVFGLTLLDYCSTVNRLDDCVDRIFHVFDEDWSTGLYSKFDGFWHLGVG